MRQLYSRFLGAVVAIVVGIVLITPFTAQAGEVPESDDPIRIILNDWTAQQATAYAAGEVLERMGYNVEYVSAGYASMFDALIMGELHVSTEIYVFSTPDARARAYASGQVVDLGSNGVHPQEGVAYPAYMDERCPGLPNWEALLDCAEEFATPETMPMGRVIDYPEAWGNPYGSYHFAGYELDQKYTLVKGGSEGAMVAEIKSAMARKAPVMVVFWKPHTIWNDPDVVAAGGLRHVEFTPAYSDECSEDPTLGPVPDKVWDCDWPADPPTKLVWKGVKDKWPAAYKVLEKFQVNNAFFANMTQWIDQDGGDIEELTSQWVDDNEATVSGWIDAAMSGN